MGRLFRSSAILLLLPVVSCGRPRQSETEAAISHIVSGPAVSSSTHVWNDVRSFYDSREFQPAWVTAGAKSTQVETALAILRGASAHGFLPADFDEPALTAEWGSLKALQDDGVRATSGAALDVRLTVDLLTYGRDVAIGRTGPA